MPWHCSSLRNQLHRFYPTHSAHSRFAPALSPLYPSVAETFMAPVATTIPGCARAEGTCRGILHGSDRQRATKNQNQTITFKNQTVTFKEHMLHDVTCLLHLIRNLQSRSALKVPFGLMVMRLRVSLVKARCRSTRSPNIQKRRHTWDGGDGHLLGIQFGHSIHGKVRSNRYNSNLIILDFTLTWKTKKRLSIPTNNSKSISPFHGKRISDLALGLQNSSTARPCFMDTPSRSLVLHGG